MEMKTTIQLHGMEQVKDFVDAASKCDFDIDIFYNKVIIDAKSILGILSMDLRKALHVYCHGYDENFYRILRKYAVAA